MTVTSAPSLDHTLPSSKPITPAPIIPSLSGTLSKLRAPVLSTIFSDHFAIGISIGFEPVANIMNFVSKLVLSPLFETSTRFSLITFPLPDIASTPFALNSPVIPVVSLLTTSSFLFIIEGILTDKSFRSIP